MSEHELRLKPVEWRGGRHAFHEAFIGSVLVGQVGWTMTRNDPTPWRATTAFTTGNIGFVNLDDAKANVEARVLAFVRQLVEVAE